MPRTKTALISGASIAGPALASWLVSSGWQVTIVERAPELRTGGQNIDVRGAGRTVARRMGVEDAIRDATTGELGTEFVRSDGSTVARFPAGTSDTTGATAELEILRGDLARLLVDAAGDGVEYVFGDSITAIDDQHDHVRVSFDHGDDRSFDLVVVADGMNSRTRRLVFGTAPTIRPLGLNTSYLTIPRTPADSDWARWFNAPGGRTMTLRPDTKGTIRATMSFLAGPGAHDGLTADEQKRLLRETFIDAGWEARRILDGLEQERDLYFEHIGQVQAPTWTSGRVALLGDAAWCASPISGMGTSLALVGAYVLAGELAAHVDHRDAFRGYERIMRPYVTQAQKLPPGAPRIANPRTRIGIAALNTAAKVGASRAFSAIGGKLFSPPADAIDLPDYAHLTRQGSDR
ncbi:FAD-dependent monooxygenase [Curtobacterium sp. VKM Ac-2865]|uniref:FAD-dependent monooxygenase n=1 Tax=Curtobacterium sp. VKM Ac-2865 TaxID=2783817 RepID=UPI00188B2427|nr:FAD-dependent monooxygenase [Curtobacterium sp. VKM Ac-2865]MBF4581665.1 FAD-dependent monooxygenase [Curtobacterium sp. VKM Ac-2865]